MVKSITSSVALLAVISLIVIIQGIACAKTPVWVKDCPKKGPLPLDDCIVKRIRDALPFLLKGYPKYRIPQLEPLKVSSIAVDTGSKQVGLSLKMSNTEIWGIKHSDYYKSTIDIPNRSLEILWSNRRLEVLGNYVMDGKVLILPIKGNGPGNITLTDASGNYKMFWEYYEKNGKEFAKITRSTMDFKVGHAYFQFKYLFNGDKALGAQMNNFLNENWPEVIREFGPAVGEAFNIVFRQLIQNVLDLLSFDSIFPDTTSS